MSRPRPTWTPPTRDGVGPSAVATPHGPWPTMLDFLSERLPRVSRADWQARMARGEVFDATGCPLAPAAPFRPQTRLWYWRQLPPEPPIPFEADLLHQDEHLVVADKPHFLPMTPKGRYLHETLLVRLKRRLGLDTLVPVHRLDRDTAGVVLFSVQPATRNAYQSLFRERRVEKVYEAIAPWRDDLVLPRTESTRLVEPAGDGFMQMRTADGPPNALTEIDLMARAGSWARYRLLPRTGRKHQLRAQLAALGVPIVGDRIYPVLQPVETEPDYRDPLRLLARRLTFIDPLSGQPRTFESRRTLAWP